MKYSIRGRLNVDEGTEIIELLNRYSLWRLVTGGYYNEEADINVFTFEVWLNTNEDKNDLFRDLKLEVDRYGGNINWHECTHDEPLHKPCVILEEYGSD